MDFLASALTISLVLLNLTQYSVTSTCTQDNECRASEICDDERCYNKSSRIDCSDGISYCYKPTQCCGVGTCCPANSDCCGMNTCCPKGAVCCNPGFCCERGSTCCGFQSCCAGSCEDGTCKAGYGGGTFQWWYGFFFLLPVVAVVFVIIRRLRAKAAAGLSIQSAGQVISVPAPSNENYGYDQPLGSMAYQLPTAPGNHGNSAKQRQDDPVA